MINKQLDTLFDRWEKDTLKNGLNSFCRDGLIQQGIDTEKVWNESERRIVFVQKEWLEPNLNDLRSILAERDDKWFTNRLQGKRVAAWLYGLKHTTENGYPEMNKAFDKSTMVDTIHNIPFALININKQIQNTASTNASIYSYADRYRQYLKEQFALLNPNVCVCCGDIVFKVVKNIIFPNSPFIKVNDWIYYERYTQTIIINSYLPTARKNDMETYSTMMEKLIEGLKIPTNQLSSFDRFISAY